MIFFVVLCLTVKPFAFYELNGLRTLNIRYNDISTTCVIIITLCARPPMSSLERAARVHSAGVRRPRAGQNGAEMSSCASAATHMRSGRR